MEWLTQGPSHRQRVNAVLQNVMHVAQGKATRAEQGPQGTGGLQLARNDKCIRALEILPTATEGLWAEND